MDSAESLSGFMGIPGRDLPGLRFHGADRHRSRQLRVKHSISEIMRIWTIFALHSELSFSTSWWGRQPKPVDVTT